MAYKNVYSIEWSESVLRRFVKEAIEEYESGLYRFGSQEAAIAAAQDMAVESMSIHALMGIEPEGQTKH